MLDDHVVWVNGFESKIISIFLRLHFIPFECHAIELRKRHNKNRLTR